MPRLQILTKTNWYAFNNLLNYIAADDHSIERYIGAVNLTLIDDEYLVDRIDRQINDLMNLHGVYNRRLAFHVILTFNDIEREDLTAEKLYRLSYDFCISVFPYQMVYFAVHDEIDKNLHTHFMIIPLYITSGLSWSTGKKG